MKILVIGGSKSGKSALAQHLAMKLAKDAPKYYWATMEPADREDQARIAQHIAQRSGWGFETVECGRTICQAFPRINAKGTVLLDSVTALLANEMFGAQMDPAAPARTTQELFALGDVAHNLICVCDDVSRDGIYYDAWTEAYRCGLAQICRQLAGRFDIVCEVVAGLPRVWKGVLQ